MTIRGRDESSFVVFLLIATFGVMTIVMLGGPIAASVRGVPAIPPDEPPRAATLGQAILHMLTASMKGMVALTALEAVSNGIQFVKNEVFALVRWDKEHMPRLRRVWEFYSPKSGIGRVVQTSFPFYGGLRTLFLTFFAIRFDAFDGTLGRRLVGNLAFIGFGQLPGGIIPYWAYQVLAVAMLAAASMTAFQDAQATEWRDVAIGEIPEAIVYRDRRGTFTRSVTITFGLSVLIMFLVRGRTSLAVPFYGIGVLLPITIMSLAVRQHILQASTGRAQRLGAAWPLFSALLASSVSVGQIVGKWEEGGWVRLITFTSLFLSAHMILISPLGYREPRQTHRIVRDKARVGGAVASIVEWQSLRTQEYRYRLLTYVSRFWALFGIYRPVRYSPPPPAGDYDHALHVDHPEAPSFLAACLEASNGAKTASRSAKSKRTSHPSSVRPAPRS
ncbi:MAG: hypothetical protein AB1449_08520 [Chloroflexota bacterium]